VPPLPIQPTAQPAFLARQIRERRYFCLGAAGTPELNVVCGGWERCARDYRVERSDFRYHGLEYVARGRGVLTLDGIEHTLLPGAVFAYRPFAAHTIRTSPEEPLVKYFIDFSGRGARRIISRKVLGTRGVAHLRSAQPVHELYEQVIETGRKGGVLAPRLCAALLELLALRIEENANAPAEANSRSRESFERCRGELQAHFRTIQTVSELARRTHLDPAYVSRLFDRFAGESPYEMLTRLKMNEAAAGLIGGSQTVKEAAAEVGFADPYHFSRVFKRHYGIAPAGFRGARAGLL